MSRLGDLLAQSRPTSWHNCEDVPVTVWRLSFVCNHDEHSGGVASTNEEADSSYEETKILGEPWRLYISDEIVGFPTGELTLTTQDPAPRGRGRTGGQVSIL